MVVLFGLAVGAVTHAMPSLFANVQNPHDLSGEFSTHL